MRRMWAASAAIVVCLALGGLPVAAQDASPPPSTPSGFSQVHSLPGGGACTPVNQGWPMELACTELTNDLRVNGQATRLLELGPLSPTDSLDGLFWWDVIIHGPDGDWTGPGYGVRDMDGTVHGVEMLTGHGAYAGLVYAASVTTPMDLTGTTSGFIAEGAVPSTSGSCRRHLRLLPHHHSPPSAYPPTTAHASWPSRRSTPGRVT